MSKLKIGYKTLLDDIASYVFTTGTEDADNPFANAYDNLLFDSMALDASATPYDIDITLNASASADYFSFYKTNLAAVGGSIQLKYWDGAAYVDASGTISPTDTTPALTEFTTQSSDKWRLVIDNNNTDVTISDIKFGDIITTEFGVYIGFSVPILAREIQYTNNVSNKGLPLGRSIVNKGFKDMLNIEFMTDSFARSTWLPFIKHAERFPFYLAWNITDYSDEIAYATNDGPIPKPRQTHPGRMAANVKLTGFTE